MATGHHPRGIQSWPTQFKNIFKPLGLQVDRIMRNYSPARLYEEALRSEAGTSIASTGALIALSGAKTGRSPGDKRVVRNPESEADIWWGDINIPISEDIFLINRDRAMDYLNTRTQLYVVDGYAGWDPRYRLKIRIILRPRLPRPLHAQHAHSAQR